MEINWNDNQIQRDCLFFEDLNVNDSFRIANGQAIYVKVAIKHRNELDYLMYELATGFLWPPTNSQVALVDVVVDVNCLKPSIY